MSLFNLYQHISGSDLLSNPSWNITLPGKRPEIFCPRPESKSAILLIQVMEGSTVAVGSPKLLRLQWLQHLANGRCGAWISLNMQFSMKRKTRFNTKKHIKGDNKKVCINIYQEYGVQTKTSFVISSSQLIFCMFFSGG